VESGPADDIWNWQRTQASRLLFIDHKVAASKESPRCIVKSDKSDSMAAHKPEV
jgi:hypothetical protein